MSLAASPTYTAFFRRDLDELTGVQHRRWMRFAFRQCVTANVARAAQFEVERLQQWSRQAFRLVSYDAPAHVGGVQLVQ